MPLTIVKERTLHVPTNSGRANSRTNLKAVTERFVHAWLFTAGYGLSKEVQQTSDVQPGILFENPHFGYEKILFRITKIDWQAGWIQYKMVQTSSHHGSNALKELSGDLQITEVMDEENQTPDEKEKNSTTRDGTEKFRIVWTLNYRLKAFFQILSLGIFTFSSHDMYGTLMKEGLKRIQDCIMEMPAL